MITNDKIEEYLIDIEMPFEQVEQGMWLIQDELDYIGNIVLFHTPPVVTFRVKLMEIVELSADIKSELYELLLRLNATDMVAGAYGLENNAVVIVDSLQSENLDFNEFQASIDAITMSIREHYHKIRAFIPAAAEAPAAAPMTEAELEDHIMAQ